MVTPDYMHDILRAALEVRATGEGEVTTDDDARRSRRDQLDGERGTPGSGVKSRSIHL